MITIIKQNNDILKFLEQDKYTCLNILGYLDYNPTADIYLWENDLNNGLIVGDDKEPDFFFVHTLNTAFIQAFWESLPPGNKYFSAVPKPMALIFQHYFVTPENTLFQNICQVYALKGNFEPIESSIYQVESLTLADAEEVDKYYIYRHDNSIIGIRENIALKDSACIRIDGQLAAWCTVHAEDNSLGPLYTKEQYRGQGLAAIVVSDLIKKLLAKSIIPYAQIVEGNNSSLSLVKKFTGLEYTHDCVWFGVNKK